MGGRFGERGKRTDELEEKVIFLGNVEVDELDVAAAEGAEGVSWCFHWAKLRGAGSGVAKRDS